MRIRKRARISTLLYASSSLKPDTLVQAHICQLNQSPWDVMTFSPPSSPPPPSQVNGSGGRVGNGSSECFVSVAERGLSSPRRSEYQPAAAHKTEEDIAPPPVKNEGAIIMRCKTDGKSWQCRGEVAEGISNSLREHHSSSVKSYGVDVHHGAAKKSSITPATAEAQRRTRPKKAPASSSSNPYEFYYYSGFGPSWGKRRGESRHYQSKNIGDANVEVEWVSRIGDEDSDFVEYEDDDDDEEDEDESRHNGKKKRVRKPIKARSLKSLL